MAITGFTGTSQLDDMTPAEVLAQRVVPTAYTVAVFDAFCAAFNGHEEYDTGLVHSMTKLGALTAAALTTGNDADPTALSDSQRSITLAEQGLGVAWGDILDVGLGSGLNIEQVLMAMYKAYVQRIESLHAAIATSLTDQVGDLTQPLTPATIIAAKTLMSEDDIPGGLFCVLFPNAISHLENNVVTSNVPLYARQDMLSRIGPALDSNYQFTYLGIDFFKSTQCPTSGGGKVGMLQTMDPVFFPLRRHIGKPKQGPFAGIPWDGRYTTERNESGRLGEHWITGLTQTGAADIGVGVGISAINSA